MLPFVYLHLLNEVFSLLLLKSLPSEYVNVKVAEVDKPSEGDAYRLWQDYEP